MAHRVVTVSSTLTFCHRAGALTVLLDDVPLDWEQSLVYRNHSPTGIAWGYHGSGPAQCALTVLLAISSPGVALRHYQNFKREFIAAFPQEGNTLGVDQVSDWLDVQEGLRNLEELSDLC